MTDVDVTRAALGPHTTLGLGGPAQRLLVAHETDELLQIVRSADADEAPLLLLGGGSNVVIGDGGFPGTAVLIRTSGIRVASGGSVLVTVAAGHAWDELVDFAVAEGLIGIECLSGIPGSAGATPIQNVGAYGQEIAERVVTVQVLDRLADEVRLLTAAECEFGYRASRFKHGERFVVLGLTLALQRGELGGPVRYAELARALGIAPGQRAPIAEVRQAVLQLRAAKGMVLDPDDPDTRSVGSFFTNPVLAEGEYARLCERTQAALGAAPVGWPADGAATKVSAAWLIEQAGFAKGYSGGRPGVSLSTKHTLALTNRGASTTDELLWLAREIRAGVFAAFGVELTAEPVLIGCTL